MLIRLFAAFILIPLIELILLLRLADATDWLTTLGIVVVTGIIGSLLARREGVQAWVRFQSALSQGRMPSREIQDGLMIAFAAALLLTPGLLTDGVGFLLLTPFGRLLVSGWFRRRWAGRIRWHQGQTGENYSDRPFERPIDGESANDQGSGWPTQDDPNPGAGRPFGKRSAADPSSSPKRSWTIDAPSYEAKESVN